MPNETTIMPTPRGDEPPYAQKAIAEIREQQLAKCQDMKGLAIEVIGESLKWAASVSKGETKIYGYNAQGEEYLMDGRKYIFDSANNIKSLVASVETIEGKDQENKNVLHVAILGRGSEKPRSSKEADVISVETVEE